MENPGVKEKIANHSYQTNAEAVPLTVRKCDGHFALGRLYSINIKYMALELTAVPLILHSYVPLAPASMVMEFTLIAVVLPVAAAHRLLGLALTAEGAHAFS